MLKLKINSRRLQKRHRLTGLLPGKILIHRPSKYISARAVDVSADGIGIISSTLLEVDDTLTLITSSQEIPLVVRHKRKDYAKTGTFRYGLVLDKTAASFVQKTDLIQVFLHSGCMIQSSVCSPPDTTEARP